MLAKCLTAGPSQQRLRKKPWLSCFNENDDIVGSPLEYAGKRILASRFYFRVISLCNILRLVNQACVYDYDGLIVEGL